MQAFIQADVDAVQWKVQELYESLPHAERTVLEALMVSASASGSGVEGFTEEVDPAPASSIFRTTVGETLSIPLRPFDGTWYVRSASPPWL